MRRTAYVVDPRYAEHDPGRGHPERPERIVALLDMLEEREGLLRLAPRPATADELVLVHGEGYVEEVAGTRGRSGYAFDPDTRVSARSYDTALLATGGLLQLLDEVVAGRADNGFAFVRPPGHHAERERAMGFCLFNNVAVGAAYLRRRHGFERVLIVDWDVHHGNGTQHMFEADPGVMFVSTHQYPFYPGTGAMDETGRGEGEGFTVNLPFPGGFGDAEYLEAFRTVILPVAEEYRPDFVLISAGFDPHYRDPLASMKVTEAGFAGMARGLVDLAGRVCAGRCVAVLEGGYDLEAIRSSAGAVLDELRGAPPREPTLPAEPNRAEPLLAAVRKIQRQYWRIE